MQASLVYSIFLCLCVRARYAKYFFATESGLKPAVGHPPFVSVSLTLSLSFKQSQCIHY